MAVLHGLVPPYTKESDMGIYEDLGVRPLIIIGRSDLIASCAANGTPYAAVVARVRPGAGSGRTQPGGDGGGD